MKHIITLLITFSAYMCAVSFCNAQFTGYTVELDTIFLEEGSELEFFGTYRVYANFTNQNDAIGALYSDVGALGTPLMYIDAPCGCYNPVDGSVTMDATNPSSIWSAFPEWEYDTYWTIGMTASDAYGLLPSSIWMPAGNEICSATTDNGVVYVYGIPPNALAGENLRVLIAQVTTCGDWSLQTCISTFINADQTNMVQFCPDLLEVTHPYIDGECVNDTDGDGICEELDIVGCMDPLACNFNPEATYDDGTCGGDQENDFCPSAFLIQCGSSVIANNEDCVEVDEVVSCGGNPVPDPSGGLWYSFEGTGNIITLSTCSPLTTFDTYVSVYEGGCGALTCVAGNDDQSEPLYDDLCIENAFASTLEFDSEIGVSYLVMVCGAWGETGTFELIMDCIIPGCTEPSACNFNSAAIEDGSCIYPNLGEDCDGNCLSDADADGVCDAAQNYPLEVEVYQVHSTTEGLAELDGMTTYRFYITNLGPTDFISSIYGNDQDSFEFSAPGGIYNSAFNASWSASGISQALLEFFPVLEFDSYATIGLSQAASTSGIAGASDPSLVEDPSQQISPMFLVDGTTGITVNSVTGMAYYVLNGNPVGLPDGAGRVLIMQITTSGSISGTLNVQIFPNGEGANFQTHTYMFDGTGLYAAEGACLADTDGNGICDEDEILGCMISLACNYNPLATVDDGSCDFISCLAFGCTNPLACNYDPLADYEDGTCEYETCAGCIYEYACNYDPEATICDNSCEFGTCPGCTDVSACNYNPTVFEDDGTCEYCCNLTTIFTSSVPEYGIEIELVTTHVSGALSGMTTYRLYLTVPSESDQVTSFTGNDEFPLSLTTSTSFYQNALGEATPSDITSGALALVPELAYDSWVTIGLTQAPEAGETTVELIPGAWSTSFEAGNSFIVNDGIGSGWYVIPPVASNGIAGADNRVLLAQLTTDGILGGSFRTQVFPNGDQENDVRADIEFSMESESSDSCGCTDISACNYDPSATDDDGSCEGIPAGECDCDGNQLDALGICGGDCTADADADGICDDEDPCVGALDECGICGGSGIADGACDCDGNVLDDCGVCGGNNECCPGPGCCDEGTVWNVESQKCIVLYPSDSNFDGCVDLDDLLDLLVDYGICLDPE
jgi:hypothetical protein